MRSALLMLCVASGYGHAIYIANLVYGFRLQACDLLVNFVYGFRLQACDLLSEFSVWL